MNRCIEPDWRAQVATKSRGGGPFLTNGNCDSLDTKRRPAMKVPRRKFMHLAAGVVALTSVPRLAFAQAYPTRPVRWIVAVAPGGGNDVFARLMGQWLSVRLGQPFIVENPVRATISVRRPS